MRTAGESEGLWRSYLDVAEEAVPRGNLVPDAHIVALMREHGIRTIWTHDRGFRAFDGVRVCDPFAQPRDSASGSRPGHAGSRGPLLAGPPRRWLP